MKKRRLPLLLAGAFLLTLLFVPFRHRTLVSTPGGGFDFRERRMWAPLWNQPTVASGVAEYPFRWLLGAWAGIAVVGVAAAMSGRGRP
ncbi:MAG TPA: hypothetical protein VJ997_04530 [Longimicrobiales bacterium]|nr:hypothetical protein [Longimicrobiales bacterium]